jgi:hypothetical protein
MSFWEKGSTYRNSHMLDMDFYLYQIGSSSEDSHSFYVIWKSRHYPNLVFEREWIAIKFCDIDKWEKIKC